MNSVKDLTAKIMNDFPYLIDEDTDGEATTSPTYPQPEAIENFRDESSGEWPKITHIPSEQIFRPSAVLGNRTDGKNERVWFETLSPSQCIAFSPPPDFILVGDCHLVRGGLTVLGGAPGVGKSRAALALAVAGATGKPWLGHEIHSHFRTLILQVENGPFRLKQEFSEISGDLDDWIKITPPPAYGLAFAENGFRQAVAQLILEWKPGLIVIDPWNRVAQGDKQTDYREALEGIFATLPADINSRPAILVVHHLRKKSSDAQHKRGRDLLHELAGSYQIGSSARCVFALEAASTDTKDDRVVLTCAKNNDGSEGEPSAWHRKNGLFDHCADFEWETFYSQGLQNKGINHAALRQALLGMKSETKAEVVKRLTGEKTKTEGVCKKTAAYNFLDKPHPNILIDEEGRFSWRED
jgi:hypothetical protein